jgi:hypothetical protein
MSVLRKIMSLRLLFASKPPSPAEQFSRLKSRAMMTQLVPIRNLPASCTRNAQSRTYLVANFVADQIGAFAGALRFDGDGGDTIFLNLPAMFRGEYPLRFAQSSANRFTQMAPSNIRAIVFS